MVILIGVILDIKNLSLREKLCKHLLSQMGAYLIVQMYVRLEYKTIILQNNLHNT